MGLPEKESPIDVLLYAVRLWVGETAVASFKLKLYTLTKDLVS